MTDIQVLTEDEIEHIVEKRMDELDHRLMNNDLSQLEYEQAVIIIERWASQQYRNLRQ